MTEKEIKVLAEFLILYFKDINAGYEEVKSWERTFSAIAKREVQSRLNLASANAIDQYLYKLKAKKVVYEQNGLYKIHKILLTKDNEFTFKFQSSN